MKVDMVKVWILEKFQTYEEMVRAQGDYEQWLEDAKANKPEMVESLEALTKAHKAMIEKNPVGRWIGFDGKTIYRQFCDVARASIRRNPNAKFRVIEAEIEYGATSWVGYKPVKENQGVLRYLMATK